MYLPIFVIAFVKAYYITNWESTSIDFELLGADGGQWTVDSGEWTVDRGRETEDGGRRTEGMGRFQVVSDRWTVGWLASWIVE